MKFHVRLVFCAVLLACSPPLANGAARKVPPRDEAEALAPLLPLGALTDGARVRAVWVRSTGAPGDPGSWSPDGQQLAAYDSGDGLGERLVLDELSNYFKPLLTSDGQRIVFSNRHTRETFVVDFDGSNRRFLAEGCAAALWLDPESGEEHVIAQLNPQDADSPIVRYPISNPKPEILWDQTPVNTGSPGSLQISRDGRRMASVFPWPDGGVAEVPNIAWRHVSKGCWPGIAPDNSYISFVFHGNHREIVLHDPSDEEPRRIRINNLDELKDFEVYHPAWTNHPRFLVLTGPYSAGKDRARIDAGGTQVEVYLARFDPEIRKIDGWARITSNDFADFVPNLWIEGGGKAELAGRQHVSESLADDAPDLQKTWPGTDDGLVFLWQNGRGTPRLLAQDGHRAHVQIEAKGAARFGPRFDMDLAAGGSFIAEGVADALATRCAQSGQLTLECIITPLAAEQSAPIIALMQNREVANFALVQKADRLIFRLRTSKSGNHGVEVPLATVQPGQPRHVLVSYKPGQFRGFIDGVEVVNTSLEEGSLNDWAEKSPGFLFGVAAQTDSPWLGRIEGVAIYDRALGASEAARKQELYPMPAPRAAAHTFTARRMTRHEAPDPASIAPYRRALTVNTFFVEPDQGTPFDGQEIHVAEWSLLDGQVPASYSEAAPDQTVQLQLDPLDAHPQLESERLLYTGEDFGLDLFYSLGSGR